MTKVQSCLKYFLILTMSWPTFVVYLKYPGYLGNFVLVSTNQVQRKKWAIDKVIGREGDKLFRTAHCKIYR